MKEENNIMKKEIVAIGIITVTFIGLIWGIKYYLSSLAEQRVEDTTAILSKMQEELKEYHQEATDKVLNGYALYLDGEEVSLDTICISDYKVSIDDEAEAVYLTHIERNTHTNGSTWYPMPILWR